MKTGASRIWRQAVAVAVIGVLSCGIGGAFADDGEYSEDTPQHPSDPLPGEGEYAQECPLHPTDPLECTENTGVHGSGDGSTMLQGILDALTNLMQSAGL